MTATEPSAEIVRRAIEWMVQLRSGTATAQQRKDFERWRQACPAHGQACARLESGLSRLLHPSEPSHRQLLHQALLAHGAPCDDQKACKSSTTASR